MSISKIFFYDCLSKRKIKRVLLLWVMFGIIFSSVLKDVHLSGGSAGLIGITIACVSGMYTLSSYATLDQLRLYISLPITLRKLIFSLVGALYISTLFEKLSIFVIASFFIYAEPHSMIAYAMGAALFSTMVLVSILLAMNGKYMFRLFVNVGMLVGMAYTSFIFSAHFTNWIVAQAVFLIIPVMTLLTCDSAYLIVNRKVQGRAAFSGLRKNYFLLTIVAEKVFVVNTVVIIAAIIAFIFMFSSESVISNLVWCIGAVNTQAMTMLSGDKWISKQSDMLPETKKSVGSMYLKFLVGYFLFVNVVIVSAISIKSGIFQWVHLVVIATISAIEVFATIVLEKKWRLTDWQIRKELWRHPRKYITPIIIFILMSVFSIIIA